MPGVSTLKGDLLRKELGIFTFKDLLEHYPIRHVDKTKVEKISSLSPNNEYAQVAGKLTQVEVLGEKRGRRLVAKIQDETGEVELVWFQGINWIQKAIQPGQQYLVFGRLSFFMGHPQIAHPEIENFTPQKAGGKNYLEPVYPSTEKLKTKGLNGRAIGKLTYSLLQVLTEKDLPENLPENLIKQYKFISRFNALRQVHFPATEKHYVHAVRRLKFEELFFAQLRLGLIKSTRHRFSKGVVFGQVGELFSIFYNQYLPFQLTEAQKRVLKEIRKDAGSGGQMNRLLQGDVGSGKTIVALMLMLIAAGNARPSDGQNFQSVLMAPTEILAQQHYNSITKLLKDMPVCVKLLTGSSKGKERKAVLELCEDGSLNILVGTHAVIEDNVVFKNLGLAVVDEQHKF
ncbi:MAG TPA: DEAD/DEAH box helicase, partial [Ferruginibacter sp.]|nr:DEAD/DEAH box helicase [Ferruginibacter sp.]